MSPMRSPGSVRSPGRSTAGGCRSSRRSTAGSSTQPAPRCRAPVTAATRFCGRDGVLRADRAGHFVQALYCLDGRIGPCAVPQPQTSVSRLGQPGLVVARHPALFSITGFSHHPYQFASPPSAAARQTVDVTLATLPRFEGLLDAVFGGYGKRRHGGCRYDLSEWGYRTNPPNPYRRPRPNNQAIWITKASTWPGATPTCATSASSCWSTINRSRPIRSAPGSTGKFPTG